MADLTVSYAQNAEDIVLARAFTGDTGFWVDIGAWHPTYDSVTKLFSDRGWRGVNVDPIIEYIGVFEEARPRDINVHAAITAETGTTTIWDDPKIPGHSTAEQDIAVAHAQDGYQFEPRVVPAYTLRDLLDRVVPTGVVIDFLKVDVEGHEGVVLQSNDWGRWRPRVVVAEVAAPYRAIETEPDWESALLDAGYTRALFDGLNQFYVNANEPELRSRMSAPASVLDEFEFDRHRNLREAYDRASRYAIDLETELQHCQAQAELYRRALIESVGEPRASADISGRREPGD